jgi:hypothetical protein
MFSSVHSFSKPQVTDFEPLGYWNSSWMCLLNYQITSGVCVRTYSYSCSVVYWAKWCYWNIRWSLKACIEFHALLLMFSNVSFFLVTLEFILVILMGCTAKCNSIDYWNYWGRITELDRLWKLWITEKSTVVNKR